MPTIKRATEIRSISKKRTPVFPAYFPREKEDGKLRVRSLAFLQDTENGYALVSERGQFYQIDNHDMLVRAIADLKADIYLPVIFGSRGYKWIEEALLKECIIPLNHTSMSPTGIHVPLPMNGKGSHALRKGSILPFLAWGTKEINLQRLQDLRKLFDLCSIGEFQSPSALGNALMVESLREQGIRFRRPGKVLQRRLWKYSSGGRADDWTLAQEYDLVYETDINNAYASQLLKGVPTGRYGYMFQMGFANRYEENHKALQYAASFCQARITIPESFNGKISPFYTREEKSKLLHWQVSPGTYEGWYWSPMLLACLEIGFAVEIGHAYIWPEVDKAFTPWVNAMSHLRLLCRDTAFTFGEKAIKQAIVSAIGRFAMKPVRLMLVHERDYQAGDEMFQNLHPSKHEQLSTRFNIRKEQLPDNNFLTQISSYVVMGNNMDLYRLARYEEKLGNEVLFTNFDAVITRYKPHSQTSTETGGYKHHSIHRFRPFYSRAYASEEKTVLPGVPQALRPRYTKYLAERKV